VTESGFDAEAFRAFETKGWGGVAASYLDFVTPVTGRLIEPLLDATEIGPGKRVLDIATGPGLVAARAAERGATGAVTVNPVAFVHRLPEAAATWQGILESTVRTAALGVGQPAEVRERLRDTYVRLAREYERDGGLDLPVAALIASGRRQ
jgi:hypothetical protein